MRSTLTLSAVLLLAACASSGGHGDLHQGAVRPPPPPVRRSGVGAPVIGQPGVQVDMPRSPHTRALPQTPETRQEDTIWAATPPDARPAVYPRGTPRPYLQVMHVPIDLPATIEDGFDATPAGWCSEAMSIAVATSKHGLAARLTNIEDDERRCLIKASFYDCMSRAFPSPAMKAVIDSLGMSREDRARFMEKASDTRDFARADMRKRCTKDMLESLLGLLHMLNDETYNAGGTIWAH
jgi:hypothetical protein